MIIEKQLRYNFTWRNWQDGGQTYLCNKFVRYWLRIDSNGEINLQVSDKPIPGAREYLIKYSTTHGAYRFYKNKKWYDLESTSEALYADANLLLIDKFGFDLKKIWIKACKVR